MEKIDWEIIQADDMNQNIVVKFTLGGREHAMMSIPIKNAADVKQEIEKYAPVIFFEELRTRPGRGETSLSQLIGTKGQMEKNIDQLITEVNLSRGKVSAVTARS